MSNLPRERATVLMGVWLLTLRASHHIAARKGNSPLTRRSTPMDQVFAAVAVFLSSHLGYALPAAAIASAAYLLAGDALDVAIVEKKTKGKAKLSDAVNAVLSDVAQSNALAGAGMAVVAAIGAGGNLREQILAAIIGVAIANAANFEASTKAKLAQLLLA